MERKIIYRRGNGNVYEKNFPVFGKEEIKDEKAMSERREKSRKRNAKHRKRV